MPTLVVNCRLQRYDVFIGRPSKWSNPYSWFPGDGIKYLVRNRAEAIAMYREWIMTRPELLSALHELRGKRLGCHCPDNVDCHGHVLAELADALP